MKAMDSIMGFCQKKVKVVKIVEKESRKYFSLAKTQLFLIDNFWSGVWLSSFDNKLWCFSWLSRWYQYYQSVIEVDSQR